MLSNDKLKFATLAPRVILVHVAPLSFDTWKKEFGKVPLYDRLNDTEPPEHMDEVEAVEKKLITGSGFTVMVAPVAERTQSHWAAV